MLAKVITKYLHGNQLTLFDSGYQYTSTFANSEDPDEMLLYAAFHQGLHISC